MDQPFRKQRRDFIKKASLGSMLALSIPEIVSAAFKTQPKNRVSFNQDAVVLFQGDSITDAGRDREESGWNNGKALGRGYAFIAASDLLYAYADKNLKIYNKGISGNKVYQLAERWQTDCLDLKPDVLSILIGVNDFWHKLNGDYDGTVETYRKDYNALLTQTKEKFPDVQLIVCEPFAVKNGTSAVDEQWFPAFDEYRAAAREIARDFDATWVPYQSVFDEAEKTAPGTYWTPDGVHPSLAGAQLMTHAWLKAVRG